MDEMKSFYRSNQNLRELMNFELNSDNIQCALFIFKFLENDYFVSKTIEFVSTLKFENEIEQILLLQQISTTIPSSLINSIASKFDSISSQNVLKIFESNLRAIVGSNSLKIESEDSLFEILCFYLKEHPESHSIFEFVKFSSLSLKCLKTFFEIFPPSSISSFLWNSLSTLSTKPTFDNRYIEIIEQIENIEIPFESSGTKGVFNFLRKQNNNQNPHNSNLFKLS
jgi:hypothetical protein